MHSPYISFQNIGVFSIFNVNPFYFCREYNGYFYMKVKNVALYC